MKKNLNFLRILSSDMSTFVNRLLHDEDIGADLSALRFITKASNSETATNHYTHTQACPKLSGIRLVVSSPNSQSFFKETDTSSAAASCWRGGTGFIT
jgi:hypothetical protein